MARASSPRALREGRLVEVALDHPWPRSAPFTPSPIPTRRPAAKTRAWIEFLAGALRHG
jgi:hypothetical protein